MLLRMNFFFASYVPPINIKEANLSHHNIARTRLLPSYTRFSQITTFVVLAHFCAVGLDISVNVLCQHSRTSVITVNPSISVSLPSPMLRNFPLVHLYGRAGESKFTLMGLLWIHLYGSAGTSKFTPMFRHNVHTLVREGRQK